MIEKYDFFSQDLRREAPKELRLLSIISQSFFQPFSTEDNLLVILTALTAGSGVGFNRAMLFLVEGDKLKGKIWLGPRSEEEANSIWQILSTPGIGYIEIIEYNRALLNGSADTLTSRIKDLSYPLNRESELIPVLAAVRKEIIHVTDAFNEPLVDKNFFEVINVDTFLCVPLISGGEILGEVVLDNAITRIPIGKYEIELAGIWGLIAGNYIYMALLHQKMMEMEKLAAMGEMAMFITHQLRNPLVTIGGFTNQLLDSRVDAAKRKRNLQIIKSEIERLEKILLELSHFLKVEEREPAPFDVRPILHSVLTSLEEKIKISKVNFKVEVEENLPQMLCACSTCAGEALRNVLYNAFDVTPPGGEIIFRSSRENREWIVFSVKDSGPGIPSTIKSKIFLPYYSTKEDGMGIGLAYVKKVMDACRGHIEVESEEGKGTLFKLYFRSYERG